MEDAEKGNGAKAKCFKTEKAGKFKRGCVVDGGNKKYCEDEMKKDKDTKCFLCEKELCNSQEATLSDLWFIILLGLINTIFIRLLA